MYVKLYSAHLHGLEGKIIEVEVDISTGLPSFDIVGLPGTALKESKERVRAAIKNSGFTFPLKRITVNLAPAHLRKEGSYFDLAIAMAILIADRQIELTTEQQQELTETIFVGELALDGSTRPCNGIFPLILTAQEKEFRTVCLPLAHSQEASLVEELEIIPITHLEELAQFFMGKKEKHYFLDIFNQVTTKRVDKVEQLELMEEIQGQEHVKRAFEVAACGFHHVMMVGPPGSGKTMLARRMVYLLPELTEEEALEVTKIKSVTGLLEQTASISRSRIFRSPHHTSTEIGMLGGGNPIKPGEISMAHLGVLFLDEFPEFKRQVIEGLREPLEDRQITITRSNHRYTFPASFLLIISLNPCPCGYYGYETEKHTCTCTATQIKRYQQKISGPVFDRIDMHIEVPPLSYLDIQQHSQNRSNAYTTAQIKENVHRGILFRKWRSRFNKSTSLLTPDEIKEDCQLTSEAEELLRLAYEKFQYSVRGYHKILKIARTIADLDEQEKISESAISEAIQYRSFERNRL